MRVVRCCAPDAADPEDLERDVARRLLLRQQRAWAAALTFALFIALHAGVIAVLAVFAVGELAVPEGGLLFAAALRRALARDVRARHRRHAAATPSTPTAKRRVSEVHRGTSLGGTNRSTPKYK